MNLLRKHLHPSTRLDGLTFHDAPINSFDRLQLAVALAASVPAPARQEPALACQEQVLACQEPALVDEVPFLDVFHPTFTIPQIALLGRRDMTDELDLPEVRFAPLF